MKKIALKVLTLAAVLTTAGLIAAATDDNETLNQIAGYRQWSRINPEPVKVTTASINLTYAPAGD